MKREVKRIIECAKGGKKRDISLGLEFMSRLGYYDLLELGSTRK